MHPTRGMSTHPVRFRVEPPARMQRVHVAIRLLLLMALGTLGCSSLYWVLYLALPALAALFVAQGGGARYLTDDAPGIVRVLRWLARAYAYLWLLTDAAPTVEAGGTVDLEVEPSGTPTAGSALLRLVYSIPALFLLMILSFVAGILWIVEAIVILVRARPSLGISDFLAMTLRFQFRLVAYHLSLVDRYPSLVEAEAPLSQQPGAGAL